MYLASAQQPTNGAIQVSRHANTVLLRNASHITIRDLAFTGNQPWDPTKRGFEDPDCDAAAIRILGHADNITIQNNYFHHVPHALHLHARDDGDVINDILISDNVIEHASLGGITVRDGGDWGKKSGGIGTVQRVDVLRNKLSFIGMRPQRSSHGHAVALQSVQQSHIAGNVLQYCGGAGIYVFGGKNTDARDVPFARLLIHHNAVSDALLLTTDWGGIETWQGGPAYVWSNISGGVQGRWDSYTHDYVQGERHPEGPMNESPNSVGFGFAYYLDGSYNNFVFNNIAWSYSAEATDPLASTSAFMETMGFNNAWFNNTAVNFPVAFQQFLGHQERYGVCRQPFG